MRWCLETSRLRLLPSPRLLHKQFNAVNAEEVGWFVFWVEHGTIQVCSFFWMSHPYDSNMFGDGMDDEGLQHHPELMDKLGVLDQAGMARIRGSSANVAVMIIQGNSDAGDETTASNDHKSYLTFLQSFWHDITRTTPYNQGTTFICDFHGAALVIRCWGHSVPLKNLLTNTNRYARLNWVCGC